MGDCEIARFRDLSLVIFKTGTTVQGIKTAAAMQNASTQAGSNQQATLDQKAA